MWLDQPCVSYYHCKIPFNNDYQENLEEQNFTTDKSWEGHDIPGPHSDIFGRERKRGRGGEGMHGLGSGFTTSKSRRLGFHWLSLHW